jgi:hypothetical protein
MSYTKRQCVQAALSEIGLATYAFDLSADQIEQALWRLDAMLGEWNARGIRLGYPLPANPNNSDATDDSGIPDSAYEAVITNLALKLAPSYGKTVGNETRTTARAALNTLYALSAKPKEMRIQDIPMGAGHKSVDEPFMPPLESEVIEYTDPVLTFE